MRFNPVTGTVELNYQTPEHQRPTHKPRPLDKAFARGTGAKAEPKPKPAIEAKKVEVRGVPPAKKKKPKGPSRKEINAARDQRIVELIEDGATGEEAGAVVGVTRQQAIAIYRRCRPDNVLPPRGSRPQDLNTWYGWWEVLSQHRYYRQDDETFAHSPAAGTAHIKCRCRCPRQTIGFVPVAKLVGGKSQGCIHCSASRRWAKAKESEPHNHSTNGLAIP
jgi:hypothetical protein